MSDVKERTILEILKDQKLEFITQRDQAEANLQQAIGAIYAIKLVIKLMEDKSLPLKD
jgi:hypothetical protein